MEAGARACGNREACRQAELELARSCNWTSLAAAAAWLARGGEAGARARLCRGPHRGMELEVAHRAVGVIAGGRSWCPSARSCRTARGAELELELARSTVTRLPGKNTGEGPARVRKRRRTAWKWDDPVCG